MTNRFNPVGWMLDIARRFAYTIHDNMFFYTLRNTKTWLARGFFVWKRRRYSGSRGSIGYIYFCLFILQEELDIPIWLFNYLLKTSWLSFGGVDTLWNFQFSGTSWSSYFMVLGAIISDLFRFAWKKMLSPFVPNTLEFGEKGFMTLYWIP